MDEVRDEVPMQAGAAQRARWTLWLGVVASVALALGLAWQLWPEADPGRPAAVVAPAPAPAPVPAPVQTPATDAPKLDVPPATAASPEVRDAWLARIRALVAAGHADEARASLQAFQRRYPDFALPDDLHPLLLPP